LKAGNIMPTPQGRRLDQWLWCARFVKTRSLASRLCATGAITVNQVTIRKANHIVRIGDKLTIPQGSFRRTVRLLALGVRRGPAAEARLLYDEIAPPVRLSECDPVWQPLLIEGDEPKAQHYT
jgi:ribosome-associated heat shock protein Hsp15